VRHELDLPDARDLQRGLVAGDAVRLDHRRDQRRPVASGRAPRQLDLGDRGRRGRHDEAVPVAGHLAVPSPRGVGGQAGHHHLLPRDVAAQRGPPDPGGPGRARVVDGDAQAERGDDQVAGRCGAGAL
jgi:hypothetical protein